MHVSDSSLTHFSLCLLSIICVALRASAICSFLVTISSTDAWQEEKRTSENREHFRKFLNIFVSIFYFLFFTFNWWTPLILPAAFGKCQCWRCYLSLYSHDCLEPFAHWTSSAKVCWLYHRALSSPRLQISVNKTHWHIWGKKYFGWKRLEWRCNNNVSVS